MKNSIVIIALLFLMAACTKEKVAQPISAGDSDKQVLSTVTFAPNESIDTVHSTVILNTIKDGSFTVTDSCRLFKWFLPVSGTYRIDRLALYINGYHIPTKPTLENDTITIAPQFNVILAPGVYTYELKCHVYSGEFQVTLSDAMFTDRFRFFVSVSGLPDVGDYFSGSH